MTDDELIEKMRDALEYELINGHVYKPNVAAVKAAIIMVREYDMRHERYKDVYAEGIQMGQKLERAKAKAECLEAAKNMAEPDSMGNMSLTISELEEALEEV